MTLKLKPSDILKYGDTVVISPRKSVVCKLIVIENQVTVDQVRLVAPIIFTDGTILGLQDQLFTSVNELLDNFPVDTPSRIEPCIQSADTCMDYLRTSTVKRIDDSLFKSSGYNYTPMFGDRFRKTDFDNRFIATNVSTTNGMRAFYEDAIQDADQHTDLELTGINNDGTLTRLSYDQPLLSLKRLIPDQMEYEGTFPAQAEQALVKRIQSQ